MYVGIPRGRQPGLDIGLAEGGHLLVWIDLAGLRIDRQVDAVAVGAARIGGPDAVLELDVVDIRIALRLELGADLGGRQRVLRHGRQARDQHRGRQGEGGAVESGWLGHVGFLVWWEPACWIAVLETPVKVARTGRQQFSDALATRNRSGTGAPTRAD